MLCYMYVRICLYRDIGFDKGRFTSKLYISLARCLIRL